MDDQVKDDDGNMVAEMKPVEIDWTGGSIPAGERDEFNFQAQVPATPTTLDWKAYQTYSDGSIVTWDQNPATMDKMTNGQMDMSKGGPYSETMVVNDLSAANSLQTKNAPAAMAPSNSAKNSDEPALAISVVALVLSLWALMKKMA